MADNLTTVQVLVADDHADSADSLAALLQLMSEVPVSARVAFDGIEAVQVAKAMTRVDVVVLDIEMPRANGFEAASEIRRHFGATVLLVAATGNPDMVRAAREGSLFDHALLKPIDAGQLLTWIARFRR